MHWATWRELCKPKSIGGMGFRNLSAFNQSMLAKQAWRFIRYPESLAARLFKAKYFHDRDVMEAKNVSNISYVWRSILWGRDLLKEGLRWKVGDGNKIRAFSDAWLPTFSKGKFFIQREGSEEVRVVELINDTNSWDRGKMMNMLQPFEIEEVLRVELKGGGAEDTRFWLHDQKGKWWKFLWSFDLPPRVRNFAWRVFRGFVPTEMNLRAHHVPVHGLCYWCSKGWGETSHTLIYCGKVRSYWMSFDFWKLLKRCEGQDMCVIGEMMKVGVSREEFAQWLMRMWIVWKGLCDEKYKEMRFNVASGLKQKCDYFIDGFHLARQQAACQSKILPMEGSSKWKCPRKGWFRLDVDYAIDELLGKGGIGAILRDANARIVFALARPVVKSATILHGELKGAMFGICQCIENGISPIEIFTDSILAVHILEEIDEKHSVLCEDMLDFFTMVKDLNVISISHTRREANKAAHELASLAKNLESTALWHDCWPSWLLEIVSFDSS